jgi:hypothetical protein
MRCLTLLPLALLLACPTIAPSDNGSVTPPPLDDDDATGDDDDTGDDDSGDDDVGDDDSGDDDDSTEPPCPDGVICIDGSPYYDTNDTTNAPSVWDAYGCSSTDESGPEVVYELVLEQPAFVTAVVRGMGADVDIDVHLLGSLDPTDCIDRGHWQASADLEAGTYYVVADSWVDGEGAVYSGAYTLALSAWSPPLVDCSMLTDSISRIGDGGSSLPMPATGPIVSEAHLVTVDDGYGTDGSGPWPSTITEGVPEHYVTSEALTGFVMHRDQTWAPQENSSFGQAAYYSKLPTADEAWYVNMMWSSRPDAGTRMILMDGSGRAAVVAAGYETGPGNLDHVGGTVEEVHHWFGTGHLDELTLGFAVDTTLPLGPVECL